MRSVLGRVTGAVDLPRGPDVEHTIRVCRDWLEQGETIEFELPRNLRCAACKGGGCDSCGRSGAVTLRGKDELPELVKVSLPSREKTAEPPSSGLRGVTLRVPERGGMAEDPLLPRGFLMLAVAPADESDPGVTLWRPSALPPSEAPPQPAPATRAPSLRPPASPKSSSRTIWIVAILVIIWISLLIYLRLAGIA